jgi:hypothetical protein
MPVVRWCVLLAVALALTAVLGPTPAAVARVIPDSIEEIPLKGGGNSGQEDEPGAKSKPAPAVPRTGVLAPLDADAIAGPQGSLPLARVAPLPLPRSLTLTQLERAYPYFRHAPFEKGGFNHFTLPFLYESRERNAHPEEALAFSFMLSHDLDWGPGCYCARHAYFAFKRAIREVQRLQQGYAPGLISELVRDWNASHAVGGMLKRLRGGYAGELVIYDDEGAVVFRRAYPQMRPYWTLLGDMAVDALAFFGDPPTPALVEHLHRPRCTKPESLVLLGKAAFAEEKSAAEFSLYEQILLADPGFSLVRYWYANQKMWVDQDRPAYFRQCARAMNDYLLAAPLGDFDPAKCGDADLAAGLPRWIERAKVLYGCEVPAVIQRRLEEAGDADRVDPDLLIKGTDLASRLPNQYWLLYYLGRLYGKSGDFPADHAMALGIQLAAARSPFLTGVNGKLDTLGQVGHNLLYLGRPDMAIGVLLPTCGQFVSRDRGNPKEIGWHLSRLGDAFYEAGYYDRAATFMELAAELRDDARYRLYCRVVSAAAAAMTGRAGPAEKVLADSRDALQEAGALATLEAYRDFAAGRTVDAPALKKQPMPKDSLHWPLWAQAYFQADLMTDAPAFQGNARWWGIYYGQQRPFQIIYDAYDRLNPRTDAGAFYEALEWMYPHDPWAVQAVRDRRARADRAQGGPAPDADKMLEILAPFEAIRWPRYDKTRWEESWKALERFPPLGAATVVRRLIDAREFDKAWQIALRYNHAAVHRGMFDQRVLATWLIRMVEEARRTAAATPKTPVPAGPAPEPVTFADPLDPGAQPR